jgi:GNAT superfamily N-acetyltransferase
VLYGGASRPLDPFYLGLYGGSGLPGVLDSDAVAQEAYRAAGYEPAERTLMFRRSLDEFRPVVDRRQVQFRRRMSVELKMDPPARSWWEACTTGDFDLSRFELTERGGGRVLASATYRGIEPASGSDPGRVVGLLDLEVEGEHRRQGFATFLLGESLRQHARHGVSAVEALVAEDNQSGVGLFEKLGLDRVEQGTVFRKVEDPPSGDGSYHNS